MEQAEVVTGRIVVDPNEWRQLPASTREMLSEEDAYHFAIARLKTQFDPKPHDPWPHHWQRSGPSLAIHLSAYDAVGGVPPVRRTSARLHSRAAGGFGTRIKAWQQPGDIRRPLLVEDPEITLARLRGEDVGPPSEHAACVTAAEAIAALRQVIARGVIDERATRSNVASIAG